MRRQCHAQARRYSAMHMEAGLQFFELAGPHCHYKAYSKRRYRPNQSWHLVAVCIHTPPSCRRRLLTHGMPHAHSCHRVVFTHRAHAPTTQSFLARQRTTHFTATLKLKLKQMDLNDVSNRTKRASRNLK